MYITISDRRGAAVPARQGRLHGRPAGAAGVLPRSACRSRPGEIFNRSKLSRRPAEADRLLQGPRLRLRQRHARRRRSTRRRAPSTSTFEIQKGALVNFERINIRGNTKTRDKVIRRELRISEGELYNQTQLDDSKRRVTALGFFEKVEVSTKRGAGRRQDRRQLRGHRAADRHVPDRRRLLVGRELHRPGADLAEQPVRPRPDAARCRRSSRACASCSCCSSTTRTSSTPTGRSASTCSTRTSSCSRSSARRGRQR